MRGEEGSIWLWTMAKRYCGEGQSLNQTIVRIPSKNHRIIKFLSIPVIDLSSLLNFLQKIPISWKGKYRNFPNLHTINQSFNILNFTVNIESLQRADKSFPFGRRDVKKKMAIRRILLLLLLRVFQKDQVFTVFIEKRRARCTHDPSRWIRQSIISTFNLSVCSTRVPRRSLIGMKVWASPGGLKAKLPRLQFRSRP